MCMSIAVKVNLARGRPDRKGWEKYSYEQHKERIKTIKSTIDNTPPRPHPLSNKRELEKRRRYAAIEFDNRLLLERLANIVQHKTIDNEMSKETHIHQGFRKTISVIKKRTDMQKLTDQNHRILRRIQEIPPAYNHLEWEEDAKHREEILRILAMYPEYYQRLDEEKMKKENEKKNATVEGNELSWLRQTSHDSLKDLSGLKDKEDGYEERKPMTGLLPPIRR